MAISKSKRIFYLDALRAVAILTVIAVHVYAVTRNHALPGLENGLTLRFLVSQFTGNNLRIGVDLFLMLAGALSLGREWTIKDFLGKRILALLGHSYSGDWLQVPLQSLFLTILDISLSSHLTFIPSCNSSMGSLCQQLQDICLTGSSG